MNLRIRSSEFGADSVSALEDSTQNAAWESIVAAQAAYDAAPHARLACEEIERLLRWQTPAHASRAQARRRASRALNFRLYPESLERRDVPTPVFCLTLLAASAAPSAAPWNDERVRESYAGAAFFDAEGGDRRVRSVTGAGELPERFATYVAPHFVSADACLAWSDYGFLPNDRALIELLATSAPSSRSLEPLACCA